jgi:transposase InsO family protein
LWVANVTCASIWSGFDYTAFIEDAFSRAIVGYCVAMSSRADIRRIP